MTNGTAEALLSAVFIDYDNIYLSLRRKDELAAKQFPKDVAYLLKQLENGSLIADTGRSDANVQRRLVMCRCYGNPVPRRNSRDNNTDIGSFPFVRHHFLRAGFDIIDCPPLTAQLKNSSDIRMVMDIQDFLEHKTRFDEFIILSGDADFAPMLQRLRVHNRRTAIYVNDNTAVPYMALCDGEVREEDMLNLLSARAKEMRRSNQIEKKHDLSLAAPEEPSAGESLAELRGMIADEIALAVRASSKPVPISYLADKAQRKLGHDKTVGSNWANHGSFLSFLQNNLPDGMNLTASDPYLVIDENRHSFTAMSTEEDISADLPRSELSPPKMPETIPQQANVLAERVQSENKIADNVTLGSNQRTIRDTIGRIHEYSNVPALAPSEYQTLFEIITIELREVGLNGKQTAMNISSRASERNIDLSTDDAQFVLDIISEADPWFEKGLSPTIFADRFRNAIIARCRAAGLVLSQEEYELASAWFMGNMSLSEPSEQQTQGQTLTQALSSAQNLPATQSQMSQGLTSQALPQTPPSSAQAGQLGGPNIAHTSEQRWLSEDSAQLPATGPRPQLRESAIDPHNPPKPTSTEEVIGKNPLPRILRFGSE